MGGLAAVRGVEDAAPYGGDFGLSFCCAVGAGQFPADSLISNIRAKLRVAGAGEVLQTIWGVGYQWKNES